jgi:hypothetical protein
MGLEGIDFEDLEDREKVLEIFKNKLAKKIIQTLKGN